MKKFTGGREERQTASSATWGPGGTLRAGRGHRGVWEDRWEQFQGPQKTPLPNTKLCAGTVLSVTHILTHFVFTATLRDQRTVMIPFYKWGNGGANTAGVQLRFIWTPVIKHQDFALKRHAICCLCAWEESTFISCKSSYYSFDYLISCTTHFLSSTQQGLSP